MADPTREQQIAQAVLERPVVPPVTDEQKKIHTIREERQKGLVDRSILEKLQERQPPAETARIARNVEDVIGWERDPATGAKIRSGDEIRRLDEASSATVLYADFRTRGFDALDDDDKNTMRRYAARALDTWPEGRKLLESKTTVAERNTILDDLLRNPDFTVKLQGIFEGAALSQVASTVEAVNRKLEQAKKAEEAKRKELERVEEDLEKVEEDLEEFNPGHDKYDEMESSDPSTLRKDISKQHRKENEAKTMLQIKTNQKNQMLRNKEDISAIDAEINQLIQEIFTAQESAENLEADIPKRQRLKAEKDELENKRRNLTAEKSKLQEELFKLENARYDAAADFDKAKMDRYTEEEKYVANVTGSFAKATMELMKDLVGEYEEAEKKVTTELKTKAKDEYEKSFYNNMENRWNENKTTWFGFGRETVVRDKEQIETDYGILVQEGPDALLRSILRKSLREAGVRALDLDSKIKEKMEDTEFVKTARVQVAEQLLSRRMMHEKISEAEAEKIYATEWGKEAMANAFKSSRELQGLLGDMQKEGVVKSPKEVIDFIERNKVGLGLTLATILLFIFNPIAALGLGGASLLGKKIRDEIKAS